jgi:hypothetical protein
MGKIVDVNVVFPTQEEADKMAAAGKLTFGDEVEQFMRKNSRENTIAEKGVDAVKKK